MPEAKPSSPNLLQMVAISAILVAALIFLVITMNTGDILWFWPNYDEIAYRIIVHCYGTDVEVKSGRPAFEALNTVVNESLSGTKRWDEITMSDVTYQEYQTSPVMMVIELMYSPSVGIHSQYKFYKTLDTLVIPLDGRHAESNTVFGRRGKFNLSGSFHVESIAPILEAVQENGICQKP